MFIFSPDAKNMEELRDMNLTMSELPLHSFQRDVVLLGEHMSSEVRSYHTLDKLRRQLEAETSVSTTLLNGMLPSNVVQKMRAGEWVPPVKYDNVTICLCDLVNFREICNRIEPDRVVGLLNRLFEVMDYVAQRYNIYKVETAGDKYLCCSGLPEKDKKHALHIANFALAVETALRHIRSPLDGKPLQLRFTISSGSCTAAVVGNMSPRYCLFGDMVLSNSSRHESAKAGTIQCSASTYKLLKDKFLFEEIDGGHDEDKMFWLKNPKDDALDEVVDIDRKLLIQLSKQKTKKIYFKKQHQIIKNGGSDPATSDTRSVVSDDEASVSLVDGI